MPDIRNQTSTDDKAIAEHTWGDLHRALQEAESKREFQRVLCVWLKFAFSFTSKEIAVAIGWSPSGVRRVQSKAAKQGGAFYRDRDKGGRRHAYMPLNREEQIISKFARQARRGRSVDVNGLRQAYELSVGRSVSLSTIYRLIARHDLRRFLPEARRSKHDGA